MPNPGGWFLISDPIRLGVVALGRAFVLTLPAFANDERIKLVAAFDVRQAPLDAFKAEFGGAVYGDIESLCADADVEAIYIASPHQFHHEHVLAAAKSGKHVLVEKPLAVSLDDAREMVAACRAAGVQMIVGPSHSFDGPVQLARKLIANETYGKVRMIQSLNYTDFLYRPRRPEELVTSEGGGVIFSQGVHQIDVMRLLGGGKVNSVFAMTGNWDETRATEGAYTAILSFANGVVGTMTYSGYGHFDSDQWMDNVSELGTDKKPANFKSTREKLSMASSVEDEIQMKNERTFGATDLPDSSEHHEHFGPVIIQCEHGVLRLTPEGVEVYGDHENHLEKLAVPRWTRWEIVDALYNAIRNSKPPIQNGEWGLASLEVCHGILESARTNQPAKLQYQTALEI